MTNSNTNKVYVDSNKKGSIQTAIDYVKNNKIPYPRIILTNTKYEIDNTIIIDGLKHLIIEGNYGELPELTGNIKINKSNFTKVNIQQQNRIKFKNQFVYSMKLDQHLYSNIKKIGFTWGGYPEFKISLNNIELKKSRWPRSRNVYTTKVVHKGIKGDKEKNINEYGGKLQINETPPNWINEENIWVDGVRSQKWSWSKNKVKTIIKNEIELVHYEVYGLINYSKDSNFFFENILSELQPNEYYIDYSSGKLYIGLNIDLFNKPGYDIYITKLNQQMFKIINSKNITIKKIKVNSGKQTCILVEGENCKIENCVIEKFPNGIIGGSMSNNLIVNSCVIKNIGINAVSFNSSNSRITNCDIFNFGKFIRCYSSGITTRGKNSIVDRNSIHDFPHSGILLKSNDTLIEQNLIYNGMNEFKDLGLIYTYSKSDVMNSRNSIIRNNIFHSIITKQNQVYGIYLDGFTSAVTIEDNIFLNFNSDSGYAGDLISCIFYNGGNFNTIIRNKFINCVNAIRSSRPEYMERYLDEQLQKYKQIIPTLSEYDKEKYKLDFDIQTITKENVYEFGNIIKDNIEIKKSTDDIQIISGSKLIVKSKIITLINHYCFYGRDDFIGANLCELLATKYTKHNEKHSKTKKCTKTKENETSSTKTNENIENTSDNTTTIITKENETSSTKTNENSENTSSNTTTIVTKENETSSTKTNENTNDITSNNTITKETKDKENENESESEKIKPADNNEVVLFNLKNIVFVTILVTILVALILIIKKT